MAENPALRFVCLFYANIMNLLMFSGDYIHERCFVQNIGRVMLYGF